MGATQSAHGERVEGVIAVSAAVSGALLGVSEFCIAHYRNALCCVANANVQFSSLLRRYEFDIHPRASIYRV